MKSILIILALAFTACCSAQSVGQVILNVDNGGTSTHAPPPILQNMNHVPQLNRSYRAQQVRTCNKPIRGAYKNYTIHRPNSMPMQMRINRNMNIIDIQ